MGTQPPHACVHARSYATAEVHNGAVGGATLESSEGLDLVLFELMADLRGVSGIVSLFGGYLVKQLKYSQKSFTFSFPLLLLLLLFSPPHQQIISTYSIVANWQTVEGPVSCLSVLPPSFCVLSFQSASTDCNLANQVSGFVERVTMGCQAGPDPLSQRNFLD